MRAQAIAVIMSLLLSSAAVYAAEQENIRPNLKSHIETLAKRHGIELRGKDKLSGRLITLPTGNIENQFRLLLARYNFAIIKNSVGSIKTIIVTRRKPDQPPGPRKVTVKTRRLGTRHYVHTVIVGRNSSRISVDMMLDTGASMIVLGKSMAAKLGYRDSDLVPITLQTANGTVDGLTALLRRVEINHAALNRVAAVFIEDQKLGGNNLLGMSFLSGYVFSLDESRNLLTLEPHQ